MQTTESNERREGDYGRLTKKVIGCAIEVHRGLGPGLLESTYERCLAHEFSLAGIDFKQQATFAVTYKEIKLDCGYRVDFLIDHCLIVELKSVENLSSVHKAQLLTYMKLAEAPVGLLINFNSTLLKHGIKRFLL